MENIAPGSTIKSECWKAYNELGSKGFSHLSVNHSVNSVDPTTGALTNTTENLRGQVTRQLPDTHTSSGNRCAHLCGYMWFSLHKDEQALFDAFLKDAADLYKPAV